MIYIQRQQLIDIPALYLHNMILSKLVISFDNLPGILGGIDKLK